MKALKVLLFGLVTLLVLLVTGLVVSAIFDGLGVWDEQLHLAGDYYFTFEGGVPNEIREQRDGRIEVVIPMKVEEFIVQGNGIFLVRRPVLDDDAGKNPWNRRLSDTCEHYRIDVAQRKVHGPLLLAEVKNRVEWAFLKHLDSGDFGPTLCKLSAVRAAI